MNVLTVASTEADARAASAVEAHHAALAGALALKVDAVLRAADRGVDAARMAARDLVAWCRTELIPHALAEEPTLYAAAAGLADGRLLVDAMRGEHVVIVGLVDEVAAARTPLDAATAARALQVIFESHLEKENTLVLPLLVSTPEVAVADLLDGMHELIGGQPHDDPTAEVAGTTDHESHTCACGEVDGADYPVLDAREVPHAIRHATIFGALDAIRPRGGLVLVAPHDPKPLLAQLDQRNPGVFGVEYLERGPEAWRLALVRRPA